MEISELSQYSPVALKSYFQDQTKYQFDISIILEELDTFPYTTEIGYFYHYSPSRKYDYRTDEEVYCDDIWWNELIEFFHSYNIKIEIIDNEEDVGLLLAIGEKFECELEKIED